MEPADIADRVLTANRKNRLEWYEREIEKRGNAFANILRELRDDKLKPYLATHKSLAHYLEDRWNMTPRRQQQLMAAQSVRDQLALEDTTIAPVVSQMKEGPIRELASTPKEQRLAVLRAAISTTKDKLTAKTIKQAKARVVGTQPNLAMSISSTTNEAEKVDIRQNFGPSDNTEDDPAFLYEELLHAVSRKFPNETRHQTALRYIREAEAQTSEPAKSA